MSYYYWRYYLWDDEDDYDCQYLYNYSDRIDRRSWAAKSAAAIAREEMAKNLFETVRLTMEAREDLQPGFRETFELLKPSCHLTKACWASFRKHVRSFNGWRAKRRIATPEEKKKHGETRKGNVYFTDVTYSVPRKSKGKENKENEELIKEKHKENNKENNKRLLENEDGPFTPCAASTPVKKKLKTC